MGWLIGHDSRWGKFGRDIGYGVPATCDHPGCGKEIDRGLSYVCGGDVYGGDQGCGLFFCGDHLFICKRSDGWLQLCARCADGGDPFEPTPDVAEWIDWKLTDESWAAWRANNPEEVASLSRVQTASGADGAPTDDAVRDICNSIGGSHSQTPPTPGIEDR